MEQKIMTNIEVKLVTCDKWYEGLNWVKEKLPHALIVKTDDLIDIQADYHLLDFLIKYSNYSAEIHRSIVILGNIPDWAHEWFISILDRNYDGKNDFKCVVVVNDNPKNIIKQPPIKLVKHIPVKTKTKIIENPKQAPKKAIKILNVKEAKEVATIFTKGDIYLISLGKKVRFVKKQSNLFLTTKGNFTCPNAMYSSLEFIKKSKFGYGCVKIGDYYVNVITKPVGMWLLKMEMYKKAIAQIEDTIRKEFELEPKTFAKNYPLHKLSRARAEVWRAFLAFKELVHPITDMKAVPYNENIYLHTVVVEDRQLLGLLSDKARIIYYVSQTENIADKAEIINL